MKGHPITIIIIVACNIDVEVQSFYKILQNSDLQSITIFKSTPF